jgi:hypothetical protein
VASCVAVRAIETSNARAMARPHIFLHLLDDPRAQPLHSLCVRTALALTTASWRSLSSWPDRRRLAKNQFNTYTIFLKTIV